MTYDEVVAISLELPGVEASTSYGTPALKVRKRFMARLRDDDVLVLVVVPTKVVDRERSVLLVCG